MVKVEKKTVAGFRLISFEFRNRSVYFAEFGKLPQNLFADGRADNLQSPTTLTFMHFACSNPTFHDSMRL